MIPSSHHRAHRSLYKSGQRESDVPWYLRSTWQSGAAWCGGALAFALGVALLCEWVFGS